MRSRGRIVAILAMATACAAPALADGEHKVTIKNCVYASDRTRFLAYDSTDTVYAVFNSANWVDYLNTTTLHCEGHGKGFCQIEAVSEDGSHGGKHHARSSATFTDLNEVSDGIIGCPGD